MEAENQPISAQEIDGLFDEGEDVLQYFDVENARLINPKKGLINARVTL